MLTPYTPKEHDRKVQEMSVECKVRRNVRLGAERLTAVRDSAPTLRAVRPYDWERDDPCIDFPAFEDGAGI